MHYQVVFSIHLCINVVPQDPNYRSNKIILPPDSWTTTLISNFLLVFSMDFYKLSVRRLQRSGIPSRSRRVANLGSLLNHLCNMSAFKASPQSAPYVSQGFFYLNCILFQAPLWTCGNRNLLQARETLLFSGGF